MSNAQLPRRSSRSSRPASRTTHHNTVAKNSITAPFRPCAATAAFFLYAQENLIVSLHHDTLAIDRHFDKHREDVLLMSVDNTSEVNGGGTLVASYDASRTAIIWDIFTGEEMARFTAYEQIQVAAWTRNGNVAFGNSQGNIILFEPTTAEHTSVRTIVDPITALAPSSDSKTFAIGYSNGSILVALLQPMFTVLHTLAPPKLPSPITGLAWHGSSSRQKSDMLATQTSGGDLRIWSISRDSHSEPPRIIRLLKGSDDLENGRSWFAWSKNGRIIQYMEEETRIWDVRTKDVTHNVVADVREVAGIANYGPGAILFTIANDSTVQQYDVTPQRRPKIVANAQCAPPNAPLTPPESLESHKICQHNSTKAGGFRSADFITRVNDSSEDESAMSPLQKISQDMEFRSDEFDDEQRDFLGPMSPASSKLSGTSSSSHHYQERSRKNDHTTRPSVTSKQSSNSTVFSPVSFMRHDHHGASARSSSSTSSSHSRHRTSSLRHEMLRSPNEARNMRAMDLFPFARKRLQEVQFRLPRYNRSGTSTDFLRQEMLSIVFGWEEDVEALIRDEHSRHRPGSASGVLLSKWLGELGADSLAQMVGSESMTSSDWMLLALSCSMGQGSQKAVGEAFVKRLLESEEVHPAVAILLGLGEQDQAIAVYASRKFYFEAVILTCMLFPDAWQRQVMLLRDWGEAAALDGQPEFAARCFACTAYQTQAQNLLTDPFVSNQPACRLPSSSRAPPVFHGPNRTTAKNASLKLITNFNDSRYIVAPATADGVTPILESALSPSKDNSWLKSAAQSVREPSSARTITPGTSRGRYIETTRSNGGDSTPSRKVGSQIPQQLDLETNHISSSRRAYQSPAPKQSFMLDEESLAQKNSNVRGRMRPEASDEIMSEVVDQYRPINASASRGRQRRVSNGSDRLDRVKYSTGYSRGRSESSYSQSGKRSPTSPIPMNAGDNVSQLTSAQRVYDDERFYNVKFPQAFTKGKDSMQHLPNVATAEQEMLSARVLEPPWSGAFKEHAESSLSKHEQHERRGRSDKRQDASSTETSSPLESSEVNLPLTTPINHTLYNRSRSNSNQAKFQIGFENIRSAVEPTNNKSASIANIPQAQRLQNMYNQIMQDSTTTITGQNEERLTDQINNLPDAGQRTMSRKELAARELEERRLSLARRPSVPIIPHPGELNNRPGIGSRSMTETNIKASSKHGLLPFFPSPLSARSHTVDPEAMMRLGSRNMAPLASTAALGLPTNPAAIIHQKNIISNTQKDIAKQPNMTESLAPLTFQPRSESRNNLPALLPSTVFTLKTPPTRSASAPPEKLVMTGSPAFKHRRRESTEQTNVNSRVDRQTPLPVGVEVMLNDDENDDDENVIVINVSETEPTPILAELQHLATPAPPPPPPPPPPPHPGIYSSPNMYSMPSRPRHSAALSSGFVGVINIAMERIPSPQMRVDGSSTSTRPTPTGSPSMRRRSSVTDNAGSIGSKWRNVAERIRSNSKNRAKSPPMLEGQFASSSPYETVLNSYHFPRDMPGSPPQGPHIAQSNAAMSPLMEQAIALESRLRSNSKVGVEYRDPKELRANLQVEQVVTGGMI